MDPLAEETPNWNPYRYCFNNPVKFIDPTGLSEGPGDEFNTLDDAAKDFALNYNGVSILNKTEIGSALYKNKNNTFSYTVPKGSQIESKSRDAIGMITTKIESNSFTPQLGLDDIPSGATLAGVIHTHGEDRSGNPDTKYMNEDNKMNDQGDKTPAQSVGGIKFRGEKQIVPSYVVTPNGQLLNYSVYNSNNPKNFRDGKNNTGGNNIPSDPKSPTRINHISPYVCPRIDPIIYNNDGYPIQLKFK